MTVNLLDARGTPLDKQTFTLRELVQKPTPTWPRSIALDCWKANRVDHVEVITDQRIEYIRKAYLNLSGTLGKALTLGEARFSPSF